MKKYPNDSYDSIEDELEHLEDLSKEIEQNYLCAKDKIQELEQQKTDLESKLKDSESIFNHSIAVSVQYEKTLKVKLEAALNCIEAAKFFLLSAKDNLGENNEACMDSIESAYKSLTAFPLDDEKPVKNI